MNSAQFSADGVRIVSARDDGSVRLWDMKSGECLRIWAFTGRNSNVEGWVVFDPPTNTVREVAENGWRWLAWRGYGSESGQERLPLETFGEVSWSALAPECV